MARAVSLSRSLTRLLDSAASPVYALDGERRIVYGNEAFKEWIGRPVEELVGTRCDYHTAGEATGLTELAAALCPPPAAFEGLQTVGKVATTGPDGALEERQARFMKLTGDGSPQGMLIAVEGATAVAKIKLADTTALSPDRLHSILQRLRAEMGRRFHLSQLIGQSDAIRRVREQVRIASEARTRLLIVGPPGSGREHVARTIHYNQPAASIGPLIPIDCRVVDAEQMQATLTSLLRRQAETTTERPPAALLLDIDRLRPDAQQELAGFLLLPGIELHTMATARAPLQRLAAKGKFRGDLAYALSTLTISLPPLKSRPSDIPLLAQFFLEQQNIPGQRQFGGFAPQAIEQLATYPWPRNIDELAQVVREAAERAASSQIAAADLPERIHLAAQSLAHPPRDDGSIRLDDFLAGIERELLERAMRAARGNKSKAAHMLGIHRARLLRRLVQLGLAAPAPEEEPVVFEPIVEEGPMTNDE